MRIVLLYTMLFCLLASGLCSQNLVGNPSFETTSGCGGNGQMPQATGWNVPPGGITIADLYTPCASTGVSCSNFNIYGSMAGCTNACDGVKYTGQIGYYTACTNCREYLQRQLISPLVAGVTYSLSFHTKLAPYARYGCNRMGMYVSTTAPSQPSSNQPIIVTPQIQAGMITDKVNWTKVGGTFVAAGGENYVTIGIFFNNASLTIFDFGSSLSGCALASSAAYYLCDNIWIAPVAAGPSPSCAPTSSDCTNVLPIELVEFSAEEKADIVELKWRTASEISNDHFRLERSLNGEVFESFKTVKSKSRNNRGESYEATDEMPFDGVSYYRLVQVDIDGSESYSALTGITRKESGSVLKVYPNPAENELSVMFSSVTNTETISITDLCGKNVFQETVGCGPGVNRIAISLETVPQGIFFLRTSSGRPVKLIRK